ncbi:hypothetical protein D3C85_1551590 [compost metagenome]
MAAEVDALVMRHQRPIEEAFFRRFVGLKFGFELLVGIHPFRVVTLGLNQCISINTLPFVAFTQRLENIQWCVSPFGLPLRRHYGLDTSASSKVPTPPAPSMSHLLPAGQNRTAN